MILKVLRYPDPHLRTPARLVDLKTENWTVMKKLVGDMFETMYAGQGMGLAAPQIGVMKRVIVMNVTRIKGLAVCMVNPEIVESKGSASLKEGCLSFPGQQAVIIRPEKVKIAYHDLQKKPHLKWFDGLQSICLQHELDHLNGFNFIDRADPKDRLRIEIAMGRLSQ